MSLKVIRLLVITAGLIAGGPSIAQDEGSKCEERCESDYSDCGTDSSDACNKAKQSCLETCRSAHPDSSGEKSQPEQ